MQFTDKLTLDGAIRRTQDGYGVVSARVARGGNVQLYLGTEVGLMDKALVRVYRPEAEVFKNDAIASYAGVPVTLEHPKNGVSADTWKDLAVGEVGDEVLRDGQFVRVPMMLRDANAIKAVEDGKRELSMGYSAEITFADGVTPTGEAFDAIMSDFKMNHVAIVQKARGGEELRIGDGANKWGAAPLVEDGTKGTRSMTTRTIIVDGLSVELTDKDAQIVNRAIDGLTKQIADLQTAAGEHVKIVAGKDAELAKKDAAIDAANAKVLSDADIDKRVQDRADLIAVATSIVKDVKTAGLADAAIRKAVVTAKLGDAAIAGKSEAYIDARFDVLAEDAKKTADPFARVVADGLQQNLNAAGSENKAWADGVSDLNAWRYKKEA